MEYRFTLEKYDRSKRNRYTCPECGHKKEFTRYVDTTGELVFPEYVGKCNRINNCGYHYTPSDYFRDNPDLLKKMMENDNTLDSFDLIRPTQVSLHKVEQISFIDKKVMNLSSSRRWYKQNHLFQFLKEKLSHATTVRLFEEYHVGTAKKWDGSATVFWQISIDGEIRTGKIMLYNATNGHRVKEGFSRITWVHTEMQLPNFHLEQCFFGEHLLNRYPHKPVAIVESEKTAIVCAAYLANFVWIASGGKNGCLNSRYPILAGREIYLFPDSKAYDSWYDFYIKLKSENYSVSISDLMEEKTADEQWDAGLDIADILLQQPLQIYILDTFLRQNPVLQQLIDAFGLEIIS